MNKKKIWPILLVLAVVAVAVVIVLAALRREPPETPQPGESVSGTAAAPSTEDGRHSVTFYANDGTILKIDSVAEGGCATPPALPQMLYGNVFCSWEQAFTQVSGDLEIHPVCVDVREQDNVIAMDGAYGANGDTVLMPLRICGKVCVAALDITVSYDPRQLELISVTEDGAVLYNDEEPGKLRINYISTENTVADVELCLLKFAVKASSGKCDVTAQLHGIYAYEASLESNNDALYVPQHSLVNGAVFVLPKGEE